MYYNKMSQTPSTQSKKVKRTKTARAEEPVIIEAPVVEEVVAPVEEELVLESSFDEIILLVEAQEHLIADATKELFRLNKLLKSAYKKDNKLFKLLKVQKSKATRKPAQKHVIIDSLAKMMGVPKKSTFNRQEVQRFICDYIRQNELQYEDDLTTFKTDAKLGAVLGQPIYETKAGSGIYRHSYKNLLKLLSGLFIKE
jgi:hypothetical protein